jgi:hypothetical protein
MDAHMFERASALAGTGKDLPHLSGPAAAIRQVLAAHFVRDCQHVVEIGGHIRPITPYLFHRPLSVLSVDPKTDPYEADTLHGFPCRVRHLNRKFQDVKYHYAPGSYGLVLLGYSLKPFGQRETLGELLFSLVDNARTVVLEYSPELGRAASQVPQIIQRPGLSVECSFKFELDDGAIAGQLYAHRQFYVLRTPTHAA